MSPVRRVPEPEEYLAPSFDISAETVVVIKQIFDQNDIHYKSKMLKADLIQLFEQKRPILLIKHQADGGDIKMSENKASTATKTNKRDTARGDEELLCRATLALDGDQCRNPAHAGHLTCGIKAHRAQESGLFKSPVQHQKAPANSGQSTPESPDHNTTSGNLVEETCGLKALLNAATAENARLKALYDTATTESARLTLIVSDLTNENLRTRSALNAYRGKVDRMATIFEELFGENEVF